MRGLLRLLRDHGDAVEADLDRYYRRDLRDRWRFDQDGRRLLTLRQIHVRVRHLPPDSAVAVATGQPGWTTIDYLTADVFYALAGKEHPARPKASPVSASDATRAKAMRRARARANERRRLIKAGVIT